MGRGEPLLIHLNEWKRLKGQANPANNVQEIPGKCDIERLKKLSQEWVRSWPDSVQGQLHKFKMATKNQRARDLALAEEFRNRPKYDNTKILQKARDIIFERSCYGKQLITAIAESKALEERDIQIRFNKEIKEQEELFEKQKPIIKNIMYAEFEKEDTRKQISVQNKLDNTQFNKAVAQTRKENAVKAVELEKKLRKEDAVMMERLRLLEIKQEELGSCLDVEGDLAYKAESKKIREHRAVREAEDEAVAAVWSKYHDRLRMKQQRVIHQIHDDKHNTERFKENYELVRQIQERESERFNDFVEKGVKQCKKRMEEKEREEELKQEQLRKSHLLEAKRTKEYLDFKQDCPNNICDRSSGCPRQKRETKICSSPKKERPLAVAARSRAARQPQPAGWSGGGAAHAQFAQAAGAALAECRHKGPVRKVIKEYRKQNEVLDLPVGNY